MGVGDSLPGLASRPLLAPGWVAPPETSRLPTSVAVMNAPCPVATELERWGRPFPEWDNEVARTLPRFGVSGGFRFHQREVINACLAGCDVFVRMPTGGGKSLTFQVPALLRPFVVVVSPLLSLIQDQVSELRDLGVAAAALGSGADGGTCENRQELYAQLEDGTLNLLYVTPEMLNHNQKLQRTLKQLNDGRLKRFVIDEAHCLSLWGNEFRESYLELKNLRRVYPNVPIFACSATATDDVIADVRQQLSMHDNTVVFRTPLDRRNLAFEVRQKNKRSVVRQIAEIIKGRFNGQSGIIYCLSRQNCEDVQRELGEHAILAEVYHSQVAVTRRAEVQQRWKCGMTPIIVATVAFGMGVNKRDVRFVIHHSFSKSIEAYYQEAGRAGRDGLPASCIIFYDYEDKKRHQNLASMDGQRPDGAQKAKTLHRLLRMVAYCENRHLCRRSFITDYFGDTALAVCGHGPIFCDVCRSDRQLEEADRTREAQLVLRMVRAAHDQQRTASNIGEKLCVSISTLRDALSGLKSARVVRWSGLEGYGSLTRGGGWTEDEVARFLRRMVIDEVLAEEVKENSAFAGSGVVAYISEGRMAEAVLRGAAVVRFVREVQTNVRATPRAKSAAPKPKAVAMQVRATPRAKSAASRPKAVATQARPQSAPPHARRGGRGGGRGAEAPPMGAWNHPNKPQQTPVQTPPSCGQHPQCVVGPHAVLQHQFAGVASTHQQRLDALAYAHFGSSVADGRPVATPVHHAGAARDQQSVIYEASGWQGGMPPAATFGQPVAAFSVGHCPPGGPPVRMPLPPASVAPLRDLSGSASGPGALAMAGHGPGPPQHPGFAAELTNAQTSTLLLNESCAKRPRC